MPTYTWKGKNRMGKMQEGSVAAENKEAVIALLRRQQIMVSAVTEKGVKLKAAVRSAMIYPVAVITIAVGVVIVILWKVIPTFAMLFQGLGATLPLPTRITIAASNFLGRYMPLLVLAGGGVAFFLNRYNKTYKGRRQLDAFILKLPVLGDLMRKISVARFCPTLGTLIPSGVPILECLWITGRTSCNAIV